ncbi:hypothetical protein DIPPA_15985 [Diplonema papillatum]|nr:hypothetical protein DIPPA_15985 [Diplonema papillatum]
MSGPYQRTVDPERGGEHTRRTREERRNEVRQRSMDASPKSFVAFMQQLAREMMLPLLFGVVLFVAMWIVFGGEKLVKRMPAW